MIVRYVTGYMLGDENLAGQWSDCDTPVFICRTPHVARKILNAVNHPVFDGPRWSTIYRVYATNLDCECVTPDMIYTNQATKISIGGPVTQYDSRPALTEEQLRARAVAIAPAFHKLVSGNMQQRRK